MHAVRGGDVDLTMVDGRVLVEDGHLKTASIDELIAEVQAVVPGLFARRGAWLAENTRGAVSPISAATAGIVSTSHCCAASRT